MDTGEQVIRVLVADDHTIVRQGFIALFDEMPEVLVVGEASDGVQVVELAVLHPVIARRLIRELNRPTTLSPVQEPLTDREAEVLILVARGLDVADIAHRLLIHEQTVYRHIASILTKLRQGPGPHDPLDPPLPLPIPVR